MGASSEGLRGRALREHEISSVILRRSSSLALLVTWILTENSHHALASDHLTFGTDRLDG
jgi:hypothetical protein